MPLEYPTYEEIVARIRAEVQRLLPDLDPSLSGSIIRAFVDGLAGRSADNLEVVRELEKQFNPLTATDEFLDIWAAYEDLERIPASSATGPVTFTGIAAGVFLDPVVVPAGTLVTSVAGVAYETLSDAAVTSVTLTVDTLTRVGTTATLAAIADHGLASGMVVTVSGANESEYNGAFEITVTSALAFTYTVAGSPATPATGSMFVDFDAAFADTASTGTGVGQNASGGSVLTLSTPIQSVDSTAYAQFAGITGGLDKESDSALRARVFQSRANVVTEFNPAAIIRESLKVAGVTRVKVNRVTPAIGQVTVLFVRDNDDDIIPNATQVQEVEDVLLAILPADKDEADLFVQAPTPVTVNFSFSSITPSTTTMQEAIATQLDAFFKDVVAIEVTVTEDSYRAAISNTVDPVERERLTAFTLSSPSADVTISAGEIAVLGTVTF